MTTKNVFSEVIFSLSPSTNVRSHNILYETPCMEGGGYMSVGFFGRVTEFPCNLQSPVTVYSELAINDKRCA